MNDVSNVKSDIFNPEILSAPYRLYRTMREQHPLFFHEGAGFWVSTRYQDVMNLLKDPRISSQRAEFFAQQLQGLDIGLIKDYLHLFNHMMILMDPPQHTPIRRVANHGFTKQALEQWRAVIHRVVNELLDDVVPNGRMDFVSDVAQPLPAVVIAEIFNIPSQDRDDFQRWADAIAVFFGGAFTDDMERTAIEANDGAFHLMEYLKAIIKERENQPGQDMISVLIAAYEKGTFNYDELASLCILILVAGHVTTIDQLSNGMYNLLTHPEELRKLQADPTLMSNAVDEIIRFDTSVPFTFRKVAADIDLDGTVLPAGSLVALGLAAANHDPAVCDNPETFNISREKPRHISFAYGPHYCLGAILAKMEISIALDTVLSRCRNLRLDETRPAQIKAESIMFKGFHNMYLLFD